MVSAFPPNVNAPHNEFRAGCPVTKNPEPPRHNDVAGRSAFSPMVRRTRRQCDDHAMDVDHPEDDQRWDRRERGETEVQRLDRNWNSLLQELRVVQTGVQLLTGFLLTLPFQQRFDVLGDDMRVVYLATVGCSVAATLLLFAPAGMHRLLFRRHRIAVLVSAAHRCAYAGVLLLG